MQRTGIRFGIDRDGSHAEALGGARDTAGNFAAVSDEDGAQHLASERVTGARSTHCTAGGWPALACGGGDCGGGAACGGEIGVVPGVQTGSTGGTKVAAEGAAAGGGELLALREDRRADAAARASPAGAIFGSGFMMLTAGIEAALGKSASTTTFFWA